MAKLRAPARGIGVGNAVPIQDPSDPTKIAYAYWTSGILTILTAGESVEIKCPTRAILHTQFYSQFGHRLAMSDHEIESILFAGMKEIATPATPGAGSVRLYAKTDKKLYALDSTGAETPLW